MPFCSKLALSRPRCSIVLILSFPRPPRSGLGMLPQPYCASACARRTDCVSLRDGVTNRLDVPSKGHPQSLAAAGHGSRLLARPTPRRVSTKRLKPQYAGQSVARLHKAVLPRVRGFAACRPVQARSGLRCLGLPCKVSLDGWYRKNQGAPWATAAIRRRSTIDSCAIRCKHPDMEAFAMRPVGYSLADRRRCNDPAID